MINSCPVFILYFKFSNHWDLWNSGRNIITGMQQDKFWNLKKSKNAEKILNWINICALIVHFIGCMYSVFTQIANNKIQTSKTFKDKRNIILKTKSSSESNTINSTKISWELCFAI